MSGIATSSNPPTYASIHALTSLPAHMLRAVEYVILEVFKGRGSVSLDWARTKITFYLEITPLDEEACPYLMGMRDVWVEVNPDGETIQVIEESS